MVIRQVTRRPHPASASPGPISVARAWRAGSRYGQGGRQASILLALQGGAVALHSPRAHMFWTAAAGGQRCSPQAYWDHSWRGMVMATATVQPAAGCEPAAQRRVAEQLRLLSSRPALAGTGSGTPVEPDDPGQGSRMLAQQLIAMSQLNWRKHRLLQVSVAIDTSRCRHNGSSPSRRLSREG